MLYFLCCPESLEGVDKIDNLNRLLDCFFFSVQTLASIGYGRINPVGIVSNLIVTIEALVGLVFLGLVTGLLFSRFSRPTAKIVFSNVALITIKDGIKTFTFRVANQRQNEVIEANINCVLIKDVVTKEGHRHRKFFDMKLQRNSIPIFALSWTIEHKIDECSPLYNVSMEELEKSEAEIIVSLTGIDDAFSQPISARTSYIPKDIVLDKYFKDILSKDDTGKLHIDLKNIHEVNS